MKATYKMIDFAEAIAEELNLPEPDFDKYDEVAEFIDEHKYEYYDSKKLRDR